MNVHSSCKSIIFLPSKYQTVISRRYVLSLFQEDWSDATVVFVSSTCYSREVMHEISHMSDKLKR